jgi:hypothetical protein
LVPTKIAASSWHQTITASEPKNLREMWLASGISSYVNDVAATKPPTPASAVVAERLLLPAGAADQGAPAEPQPRPATAPRGSRTGGRGKRTTTRSRAGRNRARSKTTRKAG